MKFTKEQLLERIKAAYAATKLTPIRCAFFDILMDGTECGCPLTALVNEFASKPEEFTTANNDIESEAAKLLDVDKDWINGFISGIDDFNKNSMYPREACEYGRFIASNIVLQEM